MSRPQKPLTDAEKAYFDTIQDKARSADKRELQLTRMTMSDGRPVAVVGTVVYNRFSGKPEGWQPLAVLLTDEPLMGDLRDRFGLSPVAVSPHDLDPNR